MAGQQLRWRLALSCRWLASPAPLSLAERARVVREWISVGASSPTREQSLHHFSCSIGDEVLYRP